ENVKIYENAIIKGPAYIGKNTIIGNNVLVRESSIEKNSIIGANMEVARSWLGIRSETHSGYIGDSIFANKVHVGAGFITGNVRLDRRIVKAKWKNKKIGTGLKKFGTIIGSNTEIGIHSGAMPGVLIGKNVKVGPGTLIFDNVPDNITIYAKQQIITKNSSFS
ncbi:MAG: DapH/DapD/GlmU-related protein, partial [Candidatus Njordarchaeota archaeon]